MALPLRLPTPLAERRAVAPLRSAVEVAALVAAAGAMAFVSSDRIFLIVIGVLLVGVTAFALVLSRPSVVVEVAVITMWFDSVGAGPIRTGRVVSALAIFVLFARLATSDWKPPALSARAWAFPTAFFAWAFASALWADQFGTWFQGLLELFLGFIYALIIMLFIEDEHHLARSFKAFLFTGVPIAVVSYVLFKTLQGVKDDIGGELRTVGFTGNANAYALLLASAVPIAVVFVRRATSTRERALYRGIILVFLVALVTTGSRAGLIAMAVLIVYMFTTYPGLDLRQRVRSTVWGLVTVAVGVFLAGIMNPDRYSLLAFFGDAGAGRLELWNAAVSSFGVRPIQGFSIGSFRVQMLDVLTKASGGGLEITKPIANRRVGGLEVHNTYLTILLDLGIIGLTIYLLAILNVSKNLWDLRRTVWYEWAWALQGASLCLLAGAFFGSGYNTKIQWTIVGVGGAAFVRTRSTARSDRVRAHRGLRPLRESFGKGGVGGERAFALPMDLRLRYPFRWVMACGLIAGFGAGYVGAAAFGTPTYGTYGRVLVLNLDNNEPRFGVQVTDSRIQFVLNIARSDRFLAEVKRRAGLDESIEQLTTMIDSTRPGFSPVIRITAITSDKATTDRIGAVLVDSLDAVVDGARSGALQVLGADSRSITPDIDPDYRGPLYLHLFDEPVTFEGAPRKMFCGFVLSGLTGLGVILAALLLHDRRRLTSYEDISEILEIPFVGSVPRPLLGRAKNAVSLYRSMGDLIDDSCAVSPGVVGLCSNRIETLQSRVVVGAAAGLALVKGRPVVIVDLDVKRRGLSRQLGMARRRGILDVAKGTAELETVTRKLPRWRLPKAFRQLTKETRDMITVIPVGGGRSGRRHSHELDGAALADVIGELSTEALVVINLPAVPGPVPMRSVLTLCDAVLLTVLDGWSEVEAAQISIDALDAAVPNRVGFILVDQ